MISTATTSSTVFTASDSSEFSSFSTVSFTRSKTPPSSIAVTSIVVPSGKAPSGASINTFALPALFVRVIAGISIFFSLKNALNIVSFSTPDGIKVVLSDTVLFSLSFHSTNSYPSSAVAVDPLIIISSAFILISSFSGETFPPSPAS